MLCLRQVKNYLNIGSTQDDEFLYEISTYSVGIMESICLRSFKKENMIDMLKGNGRAFMPTPITPIVSINSIKINGNLVPAEDYSIRNNMIFYPKYFPVKYMGYNSNYTPNVYQREYNVEVDYIAGYTYPKWTDVVNESDVPKELQYVCLELVKKMYVESGVQAQEQTKTISTTGESVAKQWFKQEKTEIPNNLKLILSKYRKVGVE